MEIEYKLTLEDEINGLEVDREYISQLSLLYWQNGYLFPIALLIGNLPSIWKCFTTDVAFYTGFEGISSSTVGLNLLFSALLIPQIQARLPWRNSIAKYRIRKSWSKNVERVKLRKLTVSDTKFAIDKTESHPVLGKETTVFSYSWDKLRRYYESDRGFYLDFSERNRHFIPRRVFTNQDEINKFRKKLDNNRIKVNINLHSL